MGKRIINENVSKVTSILLFYLFTFLPLTAQTYSLQQLKDSALHNNFAIRKARFDISAAQQQRREAFTKYFPNVSATGLWFNANKGMAQTTINPSELLPQSLAQAMAQQMPPQVLADLGNPINVSMMKNGTIGGVTAVQPVFAGGQIVNGNRVFGDYIDTYYYDKSIQDGYTLKIIREEIETSSYIVILSIYSSSLNTEFFFISLTILSTRLSI